MGPVHWRLWRVMRDHAGRKKLAEQKPKRLSPDASKQIKGARDARGKRRGTDEN
jgi:hypothetical protein